MLISSKTSRHRKLFIPLLASAEQEKQTLLLVEEKQTLLLVSTKQLLTMVVKEYRRYLPQRFTSSRGTQYYIRDVHCSPPRRRRRCEIFFFNLAVFSII